MLPEKSFLILSVRLWYAMRLKSWKYGSNMKSAISTKSKSNKIVSLRAAAGDEEFLQSIFIFTVELKHEEFTQQVVERGPVETSFMLFLDDLIFFFVLLIFTKPFSFIGNLSAVANLIQTVKWFSVMHGRRKAAGVLPTRLWNLIISQDFSRKMFFSPFRSW